MKRPEKKELRDNQGFIKSNWGYNEAIEDMNEWINEAPIHKIIDDLIESEPTWSAIVVAKAIRKLLKGDK